MPRADEYLRVKEAAEFLGVVPNTVRAWGNRGKVPEHRHPANDYRLYKISDLKRLLKDIERLVRNRKAVDKVIKKTKDPQAVVWASAGPTRAEDISFRRPVQLCHARQETAAGLPADAKDALTAFSGFLKSPGVTDRLRTVENPSNGLSDILAAKAKADVAEALLTMPKPDRKALAKELKAALGGKTAKVVAIGVFTPKTTLLWEKSDIDTVVDELKDYLKGQWKGGQYNQIEK